MTTRRRLQLAAVLTAVCTALPLTATAAAACGSKRCPLPVFGPGDQYKPVIDAGSFTPNVDNRWFPLPVGTTWIYTGTKDNEHALDVVTASARTRRIDGVTTRIVEDRLFLSGVLQERTSDYYAQDRCGNVWYFGEDTAELDAHGHVVDTSGSFHAGVDGAQPGVFMQKHPELGRRFRQEWFAGEAEDTFKAIDRSASATVPYGTFHHALRTEETTALEPGVVDNKVYARGIGEVVEESVKGPTEQLVLVDVLH
jgi:hypothetical protein